MSAERGWVPVKRAIRASALWRGERFTRGQALIDLLLRANHRETEAVRGNRVLRVPAGAILTSTVALAAAWGWDRSTVSAFFRLLRDLKVADIATSRNPRTGHTLITLRESELFSLPLLVGPSIESSNESHSGASNRSHNGTRIDPTRPNNPEDNGNKAGGSHARAGTEESDEAKARRAEALTLRLGFLSARQLAWLEAEVGTRMAADQLPEVVHQHAREAYVREILAEHEGREIPAAAETTA